MRITDMLKNTLLLPVALLLGVSCSESPTQTTPAGEVSARIGGVRYAVSGVVADQSALPGHYEFSGIDSKTPANRKLSMLLYNVTGPGVYPLGTYSTVSGGAATIDDVNATPINGRAGEVRVTSLTSTHIAGTFHFRAEARTTLTTPANPLPHSLATVVDSVTVTEGSFNLPISNRHSGALSDTLGGSATGSIGANNQPFVAASGSAAISASSTRLAVSILDEEFTMSLTINGFNGPGTYAFDSVSANRGLTLNKALSFRRADGTFAPFMDGWTTLNPGGKGSVTITSVTATRVRGNFSATVPAPPGDGRAAVPVSIAFDVKRTNQ